ncbi:signal peptide containing protein [Cryptosporidium canis]|uniref:Signal peptide containing protein n=1 Tax=Cryptosporidium canis TaxID=195482 RepID=A0ABQ8P3Q5_9CRYT|nr:signal peptide containing protein [Cryptosporidium canis]KAJ1614087.1 signal peptide containing protein [Cryptosporidium canis]
MLIKLSFCLYALISMFSLSNATEYTVQNELTSNSTINELKLALNGTGGLDELAMVLINHLTPNQLFSLIEKLIDGCPEIYSNNTLYPGISVSEDELRGVYESAMSQNISNIPLNELIHVPELLSNATHLRRIQNKINSPRPIRPRRQTRNKHPSNIPGSSFFFVNERSIDTYKANSNSHSDDQSLSTNSE